MNSRRFFREQRIVLAGFLVLAGVVIVFSFLMPKHQPAPAVPAPAAAATSTDDAAYAAELATIQARSYYVYDMNEHRALFAKNEHAELPLASVTKLMTALVTAEYLPASTTVTITKTDVAERYDAGDFDLYWGEQWSLNDLLDYSLMTSSNDGMQAIARTLDGVLGPGATTTVSLMNAEARKLGLANTFYINPTGLDESATLAGSYGSTYDMAHLLAHIIVTRPDLVADTVKDSAVFVSASGIRHHARNTDTVLDEIPGVIASKTGYTDLADGNVIVAFDAGLAHPVIAAVLGSTEAGRFTDVDTLIHLALEKLSAEASGGVSPANGL